MIDFRFMFAPVREFYVPSCWFIMSNNIFHIQKAPFEDIQSESERMIIEDFFIGPTVFHAKHEYLLPENRLFTCVLDAGCKVKDWETFELSYDINLWAYLDKKGESIKLFELNETASTPCEVAKKLSQFMEDYYNEKYIDFNTGKLKEKSDTHNQR